MNKIEPAKTKFNRKRHRTGHYDFLIFQSLKKFRLYDEDSAGIGEVRREKSFKDLSGDWRMEILRLGATCINILSIDRWFNDIKAAYSCSN